MRPAPAAGHYILQLLNRPRLFGQALPHGYAEACRQEHEEDQACQGPDAGATRRAVWLQPTIHQRSRTRSQESDGGIGLRARAGPGCALPGAAATRQEVIAWKLLDEGALSPSAAVRASGSSVTHLCSNRNSDGYRSRPYCGWRVDQGRCGAPWGGRACRHDDWATLAVGLFLTYSTHGIYQR